MSWASHPHAYQPKCIIEKFPSANGKINEMYKKNSY